MHVCATRGGGGGCVNKRNITLSFFSGIFFIYSCIYVDVVRSPFQLGKTFELHFVLFWAKSIWWIPYGVSDLFQSSQLLKCSFRWQVCNGFPKELNQVNACILRNSRCLSCSLSIGPMWFLSNTNTDTVASTFGWIFIIVWKFTSNTSVCTSNPCGF